MATQSKKTHRATTKKATKKKDTKKAPAAKQPKTDGKLLAVAREVLPAIKSGEITVRSVWRDELKLDSIVPLRNAFIEILGSKQAYLAMLANRHTNKARTEKKKAATRSR